MLLDELKPILVGRAVLVGDVWPKGAQPLNEMNCRVEGDSGSPVRVVLHLDRGEEGSIVSGLIPVLLRVGHRPKVPLPGQSRFLVLHRPHEEFAKR